MPPVQADDPTTVTDGRLLRSERTRKAILDALIDLVREGDVRPSSAAIAERAGVTQRTLFNQFGDMESLLSAAALRLGQRIARLLPSAGEGPLEVRVSRFCDGLATMLEEVMNLRWAVLTNPALVAGKQAPDLLRVVLRNQLAAAFDEELAPLEEARRRRWIDLLEIEADPLTWRLRRVQQELTVVEAQSLVEQAMLALVRDAATG